MLKILKWGRLPSTFLRGAYSNHTHFCSTQAHSLQESGDASSSSHHVVKSDFIELGSPNRRVKVHETWLRHHCKCKDCFSLNTNERIAVPKRSWLSAKIKTVDQIGDELNLEWSDGHKSYFSLPTLMKSVPGKYSTVQKAAAEIFEPVQLGFQSLKNPLSGSIIPYQHLMENASSASQLLRNILDFGFGVVKNVNGLEETKLVHDRISHPIRTMYGDGVTVCSPNQEHNDAAYTTGPLPLHTDTSYFTEPMGLQSFHILSRSGTGGLNCFSDAFLAARILYEENPAMYDILTKTQLPFQYLEEGKYDLRSIGPTLLTNGHTGRLEQVRYNPRHVTTLSFLPMSQIRPFYEAFVRFTEILEENVIWVQLEPGTVLFIDNWRILHGRSGFTGYRSLASAYFPRTDWLNAARKLRINF